jgi:hypothetical protein
LGTGSAVYAFLNPTFYTFHDFQNQHRKERQAKRRQKECGNQTSNADGSSAVDDKADCTQCGGNDDEIQNNSGQFRYFGSDLDDNDQQQEYMCKQDFRQYLHE